MTRMWQDFSGGTDGQNVTIASMGPGGTPASFIIINGVSTPGGGPQIVYSAAAGALLGYDMGATVQWIGTPTYLRWDDPTPGPRGVIRVPIHFTALPAVSVVVGQVRNSSGGIMAQCGFDAQGRIYFGDAGGDVPIANRFQAAANTVYWVEVAGTAGSDTTNGSLEGRITDAAGTLLFEYQAVGVRNTGTLNAAQFRAGGPGTNALATSTTIPLSGLVMGALDVGWWGPLGNVNIRPVPALAVGPGEDATITAELWDGEPGATWDWVQVSGPDLAMVAGTSDTVSVMGPSVWDQDSVVPSGEPIGMAQALVQVTATLDGETSPVVVVQVNVVPQITWTRRDALPWSGARVAPVCVEA